VEGGDALSASGKAAGVPRSSDGGVGAAEARRIAGAMVTGALFAAALEVVVGWALDTLATRGAMPAALMYRGFLAAGGWLWVPLWGAAIAGFRAAAWATSTRRCVVTLAIAALLGALPLALRPAVHDLRSSTPRSPRAKATAILRWSYRSPETVGRILDLSHDRDARVREQAMLALGVNLVVQDIEGANPRRPARFDRHPLRGRIRDRLLAALAEDSVQAVRAEAARALWKSPIAFGRQPAAAETLAAVLDRAALPGAMPERLAWLALDAAVRHGHPDLAASALRFAAATPDSELAEMARLAATANRP
jgi:hypothetical protein